MTTEVKQKQRYCKNCRAKTLHVATIKRPDLGCGFHMANLFLSVITFGLWIPIWIFATGLGMTGQVIATAPYLCQRCGRKN